MFLILPLRPDASWHRPPIGTVATMVLLLVIHVVWGRSGPEALEPYLLDFQAFNPLQWLTSGLLHADWMHLIGNLVFLYVFGAIVEDYLGHWLVPVFLLLVITSGALEQSITLLNQDQGFALGASSAIYGLMAMATLWSPRTHISTFILVLWRPFWVNIRVVWMAGCYMTLQVLTVWLQGGEPSSEFLHACGMVVGLALGLVCLRRRWVDAQGEDLLGIQKLPPSGGTTRIAAAAVTPAIPWETQVARLEAALTTSQHRVALAAYEVLRREHAERLPPMWMLERLMYLCEDAIDFHRCTAIAERALAMGPVSDLLRFSYARVAGLHLGDVELGLAQLEQIDRTTLPDEALAEVTLLQAKLERRRRPTVSIRSARAPIALVVLICFLPVRAEAVDAAVLPSFEFKPVTTVALGMGATFQVPKDLVYLSWEAVERFLIVAPGNPAHHQPTGMLIRAERFDALADERERVTSRAQWEARSAEVFILDTPIMVGWVEGWIDTSQPLPEPAQLLEYLQTQSHVINNRRLMGPMTLSYNDWGQKPLFDPGKGRLNWSLHVTLTPDAALGGGLYHFESLHHIHLGAKGVLFFIAEVIDGLPPAPPNGPPSQSGQPANLPDLLGKVSAGVSWDARTGFTTNRPDGVGERVGGLRAMIQPRILFGSDKDELDFHRGLGFAWILILLPVALVAFGLYRWITGVMRAATPARNSVPASPNSCPACGSQTTPNAPRCFSCGTSLLRR